ncbi:16S rRNA (guanine(527)-N(7))-methyltransferase RsmG [Paenibacillus macquariensis]|uniref:Ribosomal RNA small subunit methyltransferase G n=1 Tax=Paenibacillus macquariensis TaxID=948756 RepID=A0ABY1KA93_9BACL|nr:16S rRNA (guanine(527)-N(7))-methyltransferase RsmG [Paenibacillus macquariensis]MEC0093770.1 16S rRNA (guanine(527)-N(7))-methyltransferase RsmG [Paenibacillus macquariensis]OAB31714.1 16S rRNA methyltransferase G [Paenibacillus macquariensis subsp. macquariensis]SIR49772.1 16S rRNA m(7)G-527 methyltransferase [Paenibacillus macquariensis]
MDDIQQSFTSRLQEHGITLNETQLNQFEVYFKELVSWNEKMNLTGITERDQVYTKHFFDSVSLAFFVDMKNVKTLADIGSGAGFPGIPLKICFPDLKLTIIDSLNKRISFLKNIVEQLGLSGVELIHGRAEEWGQRQGYRDHYDLVTARAVAKLALLNEFCLPFVRVDGTFAAMKGSDPTDELKEASYSFKQLKGKLSKVEKFTLPVEDAERHIIIVQKRAATPQKYPRSPGVAAKSPLI